MYVLEIAVSQLNSLEKHCFRPQVLAIIIFLMENVVLLLYLLYLVSFGKVNPFRGMLKI